jgi:uncharacterized protein YbbK (DUF523 family)/uncharacterized protein YbgA (DUF1722 family)
MTSKPKVAVSSCLLGKKVRYNGDAAEFRMLNRVWSDHLELIGVCPEVAIGMGVPRPTIRLVKGEERISLINPKNGDDYTDKMLEYAEVQSDFLINSGISGFVFKKGSPSCGLERVKVYRGENAQAEKVGAGMFAKVFTTLYPHIPVIEEGRLSDPLQAEHFLARVYFFNEWLNVGVKGWSAAKLMQFHSENKLFLLSRAPDAKRILGRVIANAFENNEHPDIVALKYMAEAQKHLSTLTTPGRIAHAMERIVGRLPLIPSQDRKELIEVISRYRKGLLSRSAALTLLGHHINRYGDGNIRHQNFLAPIPYKMGLMARV